MEPATEQRIAAVPSLDEIARDPRCAAALGRPVLNALLMRNAVAQSVIVAQLSQIEAAEQPAATTQEDKMLTVDEAAVMLRRSRQWIYRNAPRLPFVKRISRKSLLCSEAGIRRWLASRKA